MNPNAISQTHLLRNLFVSGVKGQRFDQRTLKVRLTAPFDLRLVQRNKFLGEKAGLVLLGTIDVVALGFIPVQKRVRLRVP